VEQSEEKKERKRCVEQRATKERCVSCAVLRESEAALCCVKKL
jgi:hypothetical protein